MSVKELRCPKCGAPVSPEKDVCEYCKTHYIVANGVSYTPENWGEQTLATDENVEIYLNWHEKYGILRLFHHIEALGGDPRKIDVNRLIRMGRRVFYMARDHLKEEKEGKLPTIAEVCERAEFYIKNLPDDSPLAM